MVRIEEGMLLQVTALRESCFDWLKNVGNMKKMKVVQTWWCKTKKGTVEYLSY